ncbi:MAG TPA: CPBP family intramembrane glutamic endopeptidase [Ktedonobacteraceae bacterium]
MNNQSREPYQVQTPEPPPAPPQPDTSPQYLWTWRDVILIMGTAIALLFLGIALSTSLVPNFDPQNPDKALDTVSFTINSFIVEFIALVGSVYFVGLRRKKLNWHIFGLQPLSTIWLWIACGLGVIEYLLETGVSQGIQYLLKIPDDAQIQGMATQGLTWVNLVILVALAGLAIPFAEEILFRGVIYTFIRERWGIWVGIIASALLYALVSSFDIVAGSAAFVLGVVTAFAYERSKSLWAAVTVHVFSSMLSLIVFYVLTLPGMHVPFS